MKNLENISPIDGRYAKKVDPFRKYFSEKALIYYRLKVEIFYFLAIMEDLDLPAFSNWDLKKNPQLMGILEQFSLKDAERIKSIEKTTNHDVKAVEYFLKEKFSDLGLASFKEFIHFGLTSQDINNTAVPLSIKESMEYHFLPELRNLIFDLEQLSNKWKAIPMLSRTHGQPASPTRVGKELMVFVKRLKHQFNILESFEYYGKFGGATGNFNAHFVAYPDINWHGFACDFLQKKLGLKRSFPTTQIDHYDNLSALFSLLHRINTILIDFSGDIWMYISMDYFKQKIKEGEVGSSAMPHKVNPIDFENAEGNFGVANAIYYHLSSKLPISRLQRDLTDSTVLRNVGVPITHTFVAIKSLRRGLDKLILNEERLNDDLNKNWAVVSEAIQTILRREKYPNPYETLKELTRTHEGITEKTLKNFIAQLKISQEVKDEMVSVTPFNYLGK